MRNFRALADVARYLYSNLNTVWDDYDFTETSPLVEKRVPQLKFNVDVTVMVDDVYHNVRGETEEFVRMQQIKYANEVYIFAISTHLNAGTVARYSMNIYTPAGDGKGGYYLLYQINSIQ
ncbi:MAG: hypothetical protein IKK43_01335 [Clostridia bacterium]|nr:hypothetical protein [Clostridia bacterium]